jgi:hypothetical protein
MGYAFHRIWIDQCDSTEEIRERFGLEKAIGYLIGEKLLNFIEASDKHPDFKEELPKFAERIKEIFQPNEIKEYLENVKRVGALGHVCTDEEFETFRKSGAIHEDPVSGAKDVLLLERAKELLMGE